ncbi:MAG: mannosyltransferase [Actinomycetota bacterium]
MRLSFTTKTVIVLALLAALLSFTKFDHCYNKNWTGTGIDAHECYSDLPALFDARGLVDHVWPYSSATNSVEYPPLTGIVMWATALITPQGYNSDKYYFLINIFLLALLFIGICFIVSKINPKKWYLLPVLPAVIASLYINWDLWAVISAVAAIYWFDRKRYELSSIALAISIATKFFPVVLLIPIAIIFLRNKEMRNCFRYIAQTALLWILINLPFALTTPSGWWRFFKLNGTRPADLGSVWQALNIFNINTPNINFDWIALFILGSAAVSAYLLRQVSTPTLAQVAFVFVALFTALNKVYSPQYVLWLAPLGVIALVDNRNRAAFWIWQGSEAFYHFAIWEYLAEGDGGKFGLPARWYAAAIFIRILASLYFGLQVLISTPAKPTQEHEFLLSSSGS